MIKGNPVLDGLLATGGFANAYTAAVVGGARKPWEWLEDHEIDARWSSGEKAAPPTRLLPGVSGVEIMSRFAHTAVPEGGWDAETRKPPARFHYVHGFAPGVTLLLRRELSSGWVLDEMLLLARLATVNVALFDSVLLKLAAQFVLDAHCHAAEATRRTLLLVHVLCSRHHAQRAMRFVAYCARVRCEQPAFVPAVFHELALPYRRLYWTGSNAQYTSLHTFPFMTKPYCTSSGVINNAACKCFDEERLNVVKVVALVASYLYPGRRLTALAQVCKLFRTAVYSRHFYMGGDDMEFSRLFRVRVRETKNLGDWFHMELYHKQQILQRRRDKRIKK